MTPNYTVRETCRLCGSGLREVLRLADTPLANELVDAPGTPQAMFPLFASTCVSCGHYQCPVVVRPALIFQSYPYVSGTSPVFREHLSRLGRKLSAGLFPDDLVVEIGSNDGTLLRQFTPPVRSLGVDPARNLAERATRDGALTYPGFFDAAVARSIRRSVGRARLILALNVLAHSDDLDGIAAACAELLADDGELVFEVAYLPDMLHDGTFDMHYLEHLAFHHLAPLVSFYDRHGLTLYDAEHVDSQGGSIRCWVSKKRRAPTDRLVAMLEREKALVTADALDAFKARIASAKAELTELLGKLKARGAKIAGFGCPAKATTLLHHFGIGRETLDYLVEENPLKVGKFSPGKHIPIVGVERLKEDPPDFLLLLAWNFAPDIMRRFPEFEGKWILPMPEIKIC